MQNISTKMNFIEVDLSFIYFGWAGAFGRAEFWALPLGWLEDEKSERTWVDPPGVHLFSARSLASATNEWG
jgi:hypothetical protein